MVDFFEQGVAYPFVGEVGRVAGREIYATREEFFPYSLGVTHPEEGEITHVLLPIDEQRSEVTLAGRLGSPGNLTTFGDKVSVGLENDGGTVGSTYFHSATPATASRVPTPGSTICAVEQQGSPPVHTITFRAMVTGSNTITNNVTLTSAGQYGQATSQAVFTAISNLKKVFMPFIKR